MKYDLCILANENPLDHNAWIRAIENSPSVKSYDIISLVSDDWFNKLNSKHYDLFLLRPPGKTELFKKLYDERTIIIDKYFKTPIYPDLKEVLIYENKRFLRDWLMITNLPHPETHVFFNKKEAERFIFDYNKYPIMGKMNIGASGNGIIKLNNQNEALNYISQAFTIGIRSRKGPKFTKGNILHKFLKLFKSKHFLSQRMKDYIATPLDQQYHYIILQEYVPHSFEWRCVKIGESFFAHKKIVKGDMASGTLKKGYDPVPSSLLTFIKDITDSTGLNSVSIDLFEKNNGFLINEIQCFFGQSDPYQMLVEGKPGRYIFKYDQWIFEEGDFATNSCYDLRLKHALSLLNKK